MLLYFFIAFTSILLFLYFGIPKEGRPSLFSLVGEIMSQSKRKRRFELSALSLCSLIAGGVAMVFLFKINQSSETEQRPNLQVSSQAPVARDAPPPAILNFRNEEGCYQLGEIAANAFATKEEGHSLQAVLANLQKVHIPDPQRRQAAEGVVIAIYGDSSIRSRADAHNIAYTACKG